MVFGRSGGCKGGASSEYSGTIAPRYPGGGCKFSAASSYPRVRTAVTRTAPAFMNDVQLAKLYTMSLQSRNLLAFLHMPTTRAAIFMTTLIVSTFGLDYCGGEIPLDTATGGPTIFWLPDAVETPW